VVAAAVGLPKGLVGGGPKAEEAENGPLRNREFKPPDVPKYVGAIDVNGLLVCVGGDDPEFCAEITPGLARKPLRTSVESRETV
jgi:hypothetical protein